MKFRTILLTTVCALAPIGTAAYAQADDETGTSRDIIVTAQKRAESLEDVPISITALSEERLSSTNVTNFTEIDSLSPGMAISQTGPFFLPAIRGVTSQAISGGNENNIATYIDDVYQPNQLGLNFDLASVAGIEILKGPQGTLFGRNATGGAILVRTLNPSDKFEGRIKLSYGRFNDWRTQVYLSVPVSETLGFNIAGLYRKSDGFLKNVPTRTDPDGFNSAAHEELNIRTKLRWDNGEGFKATLALQYVNLDANGSAWQYVDRPGAELVAATRLGGAPTGMTRERNRTSYDDPNESKSEVIAPSLTLEFELGGLDVKTISSYQHIDQFTNIDIDGSLLPIARQVTDHKNTAHSEEINISSSIGDSVDWVAGMFYFTNRWLTGPNQVFQGGVGGARLANILKAKSWAAFADATVKATDRLSIIGGVRYSWEKRQQTPAFTYGGAHTFIDGSWSNLTPRIILQYELADRTNVYASFSKGFKSGNIDLNGRDIKPEKINAFEAGFKTVKGSLRFDVAAYYYDYTNLQDQQVQAQPDQSLRTVQANVGSAEIYGAEAQVDYTPSENLSLFAGVSWLHAQYTSYPGSAGVVAVAIPNTPFFSWTALPQDLSGREMPRSPKFTLSGGFNYTIDAGNTGSFDIAGSASYKSSHNPNRSTFDAATGNYLYRQKGYALVNASLTWHSPDDTYEISVFGRNIFDQQYNAVFDAFSTFGKYRQFGEPATYGVSVGVNF